MCSVISVIHRVDAAIHTYIPTDILTDILLFSGMYPPHILTDITAHCYIPTDIYMYLQTYILLYVCVY